MFFQISISNFSIYKKNLFQIFQYTKKIYFKFFNIATKKKSILNFSIYVATKKFQFFFISTFFFKFQFKIFQYSYQKNSFFFQI